VGSIYLAVFSLLALLASPGAAQEAPFDFKGIALGSDLASLERSARFSCTDPKNPVADQLCRLKSGERETLGGAPVKGFYLYYYSGKLEMISVTLDHQHFDDVIAALTRQYGAGTVESETLQNITGKTFDNKIHTWRRQSATLEAQRFGRTLDTTTLIYRTDFSLQEYARRTSSAEKDKAKDP
jgi:hypothetical protein